MKLYILVFLSLVSLFGNSQNHKQIDSVFKLLHTEKELTTKSLLYAQLAELYKSTKLDSAIYFANRGYKLADSLAFKLGIAKNTSDLADYYVILNNLEEAKKNYSIATKCYLQSDKLFEYTQYSIKMGNIDLAQDNHIEALKVYQKCLKISEDKKYNTLIPHLYNNMGIVYLQIEDYDDAKVNFKKAYDQFLKNKDEENLVYPLYNISNIESITGHDEEAINGYLSLTEFHLKSENWVSLASVYNNISEIYLKNKDYKRAQDYLQMALNAMEDKRDSFNTGPSSYWQSPIYTNAAQLFFIEGDLNKTKKYAHKAIKLALKNSYLENIFKNAKILGALYDNTNRIDSALVYNKIYIEYYEKYQNEYDVKQLTKLKMQNEFDEILRKNEIERIYKEASYKNRELKFIGFSCLAGLLAIILVLLYLNVKHKNAKLKLKEENLRLEKKKLNQDLDYKKKELASNMMYLMEKNEFISSISKKLIELKPDVKKDNKELIQQIINEIRQNSSTKMWEEFEIRFKEVHARFYNQLHKAHPDLTLNEVKICAFLRLNMSTKEISAITHQSLKSINMARFRLRKKLNIEREENIIAYLKSL